MTIALISKHGAPVGRAEVSLPPGEPPQAVTWREKTYVFEARTIAAARYVEVEPFKIPDMSVREAPKMGGGSR